MTHNHNTTSRAWGKWLTSHKLHGWEGWVMAPWTWPSRDSVQAPYMKSRQIYIYIYGEPTKPKTVWPHHQGLRLLFFSNSGVCSFTSHKNQISESTVRCDPQFFSPYLRRLEILTICRCHHKAALSSQLFKDPECWSSWDLNRWPPAQQTGGYVYFLKSRLSWIELNFLKKEYFWPSGLLAKSSSFMFRYW